MPRPAFPPTPAPSTDIKGRQASFVDQAENGFTLPPSAVGDAATHRSSVAQANDSNLPDVSPISPTSPEWTQTATPAQDPKTNRNDVALPPPPARSRKIIQVQPKAKSQNQSRSSNSSQPRRSARAAEAQSTDKPNSSDPQQPQTSSSAGKKSGGTNTAAGRKVARKTAHSIIERRRRSKMNEEFGILKDLIPACRGYEMHKLAILQASIDYLRYLERCVSELKANQSNNAGDAAGPESHNEEMQTETRTKQRSSPSDEESEADEADDNDNDNEMELDDPEPLEPQEPLTKSLSRVSPGSSISGTTAITSPAFSAYSHSRGGRPSTANLPSPAFGPIFTQDGRPPLPTSGNGHFGDGRSYSNSTQTSPNILPMAQNFEHTEALNEASAALLMLNAKDRRTLPPLPAPSPPKPTDRNGQRGMSVKDLLRT